MSLLVVKVLLAVIFITGVFSQTVNETKNEHKIKEESAHMKLLKVLKGTYNRHTRPYFMDKPTDVEVFLYIGSLRSVSEATMTCSMELYFREYWTDPRLAGLLGSKNITQITLHESLKDLLWLPDTFVPNAILSDNPASSSVTHRSLLRLSADGHLLYSRRISVTAECPMDLSLYPFDEQTCALSIESYGFPTEDVVYRWRGAKPVVTSDDIQLPQFRLGKVSTLGRNVTLITGTYSRLECCFHFKRSAGFQFVQVFVPSTSVVVISWSFMWMEKLSSFSDMISVLLGMTFLYCSHSTMMPKVAYIKAIDIYLTACFTFVFMSLIKLAIMKYLKMKEDPKVSKSLTKVSRGRLYSAVGNGHTDRDAKSKVACGLRVVRVGLVVFPVAFLVFCVIYFVVYVTIAEEQIANSACNGN